MRIVGIDPASTTGFIAMDMKRNVLVEKELTGAKGGTPEYRVRTLMFEVADHLQKDDVIGIEWFALEARDTNKVSSGNNWAARLAADSVTRKQVTNVNPGSVKKFLGVGSHKGVVGSKVRKETKELKADIVKAVFEQYGYPAASDNIADAYVIAEITRLAYLIGWKELDMKSLPNHQFEVLYATTDPKGYEKYQEELKNANKNRGRGRTNKAGNGGKNTPTQEPPTLF